MPLLTITSDFGDKDYYHALIKARLLRVLPELQVFDISHQISPYNILHGSIVFKAVFNEFEIGSIHLLAFHTLGTQTNISPKFIAVESKGKYIFCANNGTISLLDIPIDKVVALDSKPSSFPTLDIFIPAIQQLIQDNNIEKLGNIITDYETKRSTEIRIIDEKIIQGNIIYMDDRGNLITNISKAIIEEKANGRSFTIKAGRRVILSKISQDYGDIRDGGDAIALFNQLGLLEISNSYGNAKELFGLDYTSPILVNFE